MNTRSLKATLVSNPYLLSSTITLSYFVFYTGYDKGKKTLVLSNLMDMVLFRRSMDWSLVEFNKALSLSGLTIMLTSFLPEMKDIRKDLLWISMQALWFHSVYSTYKFYQFSPKKLMEEKPLKKLSIALGCAGQVVLSLGFWGQICHQTLAMSATALGLAHFWTMEVDYKYKLQVRPYAYVPFIMGAAVARSFIQDAIISFK